MSRRVAVYAAPAADDPLWRFGSRWLGYDAETGAETAVPPEAPAPAATWTEWTAAPRLYGFHGTLKAPFRLAAGLSEDDAEAAIRTLAAGLAPVRVPRLAVRLLGRFVALMPAEPNPALDALAASCVEALEPLRAPLGEAESARRLASPLTPRQVALLDAYGYPYVLDQFRFHMTLTGPLPPEEAEGVRAALEGHHAEIAEPFTVEALCLFVQDGPGARFRIRRRLPLGG